MHSKEIFQQILKKKSFLCVGLDPEISKLPACVAGLEEPIFEFNRRIIDATQLLTEIDAEVRGWLPRTKATTPQRLTNLSDTAWRPQDYEQVTRMARRLTGWCDNIVQLFDPEHRKYISAPCPSCGKATVYKRDSAGDIVRQPALTVVAHVGCTCQHCDAHWSPDRYLFLCRLLGFELPAGVLE